MQVYAQTYDPADRTLNGMLLNYIMCIGLAVKLYGVTNTHRWSLVHGMQALNFPMPFFDSKDQALAKEFKVFEALSYTFPLAAEEKEEEQAAAAAGSSSPSAR